MPGPAPPRPSNADPRPTGAQRRAALRRHLRAALADRLIGLLTAVLARLSWPAAQRWGRGLGAVAWHLARRDRRRALEHLEVAFPDLPSAGRRRLARASFRHLGVSLAECLHLLGKGCPEILAHVEVEGWEGVEALAAAGRPLLLLTGHCGNWELLGPVASCRGRPIAAVVRALDEPALHRRLAHLRETFGSETIDRGSPGAPRKLLESLRGGRPLLMLIDQDTRVDGVWVPFFGRLAYTPVGAAKIARRQRAAVVPAFVERLPDGSHRARFQPPLELPDDPVEATALMTARIEEQIRRRPEQWVWMHRRWRRRPPEEG